MKNDVFYNPGAFGDIIYAIPFCLSCVGTYCYEDLAKNQFEYLLDLCLIHNRRNDADGAFHALNMVGDILKLQPYIKKCMVERKIPFGNFGALDLGIIRKGRVDMAKGDIVYRYHFLRRLPQYYNSESPWLVLGDYDENKYSFAKGKIIVFRSSRYRNTNVDFSILKKYADKCIYVGTENEYTSFKESTKCNMPLYKGTFIDIARVMSKCAFVVGNQTFFFSLAEALKVPRICEMSSMVPDVIPRGKWGNEFIDQQDFIDCLKLYADELL